MKKKIKVAPVVAIKKHLDALALNFKNVTIRYKVNERTGTHIVELTPEEVFYNNEALDAFWIPFCVEFNLQYEDAIVFISADSTLRITKPDMEWKAGKCLSDKPSLLLTREQVIPQQSFALTAINPALYRP
ncbi:hypothetical protein [Chitinophaga sp. Cy-1792]|uniref:hypothetical protein n=1 Tax=Chitinophaga sp. Cy-1792 TaxID=2608339 RepID=UPI00141E6F72|nr:hypothetical protein [Chitinophaga sp. Cy-1792]NIG55015.1 hypothetical protein [Chitinophaga sp. Cy-1792]